MWVARLDLRVAPGLPDGLGTVELRPGLNLVVGPNASGKSTLARTVRGTLWPSSEVEAVFATSSWRDGATVRGATLAHGRASWTPEAPSLPAVASPGLYALGVASLLAPGRDDQQIAGKLGIELAGGYDLDAAARRFELTEVPPTSTRRAVVEAQRKLRESEAETDRLADLGPQLQQLRDHRAAATRAGSQLPLARHARDLVSIREKLRPLLAELGRFPPGLHLLNGDEADRLDAIRQRAASFLRAAESAEAEAAAIEAQITSRALPHEPSPTELDELEDRIGGLAEAERTRDALFVELGRAEGREAVARRQVLDAGPSSPGRGLLDTLDAFERTIEETRAKEADAKAAAEVHAAWLDRETNASPLHAQGLAKQAALLRAWLAAPPPTNAAAARGLPWPAWLPWVALGVGLGALVLAIGQASAVIGSLAGIALGVGAVAIVLRVVAPPVEAGPVDVRADLEARGRASGCAPRAWDVAHVEAELDTLDAAHRRAELAAIAAQAAASSRRTAEALANDAAAARAEVADRVAALGLAPGLADLGFAQQARAIAAWAEAEVESEAARGALRNATALHVRLLEGVANALDRLLPGDPPVDTAARARARLAEIHRRVQELTKHRADRVNLRKSASEDRQHAADATREAEALLAAVGLVDDAEALRERLEVRPAWLALHERANDLGVELRAVEPRVDPKLVREVFGIDLDHASPHDLEAIVERLGLADRDREAIASKIGNLEQQIDSATTGRRLEDARAALAEARDALADARDEAAAHALARLVLDAARAEQARTHAPPVLERARAWFGRFTHHAWRLELDPLRGFHAVQTSTDRRTELAQLSDATRMQLLLAARLAAIEAQEGAAGPMPITLDEALSMTDPVRFTQVAGAIVELAEAGRQVVYLTADPSEAAQWERACVEHGRPAPHRVVLGARGADPGSLPSLHLDPVAAVPPPPSDGNVDAWARTLHLHAPSGHRPASQWHLLYLLPDDLDAVHRLLSIRIDTVGAWRALREAGPPEGLLPASTVDRLDGRVRALEAVLDSWRVGRGRPVTWADVEASRAVSETFALRVRGVLDAWTNDPAGFVEQVASLKGFRAASAQQLAEHLESEGILDSRQPVGSEALRGSGLFAVGRVEDAGFVDRLVGWLEAAPAKVHPATPV